MAVDRGDHRHGHSISATKARSKISCCALPGSACVMPLRSFRSPPAQNARSPAPVSTTQRSAPGVGGEARPQVEQVAAHLRVDRVEHLGPVERHEQDMLALGVPGQGSGMRENSFRGLLRRICVCSPSAGGRRARQPGRSPSKRDRQADERLARARHRLQQPERLRLLVREHLRHVLHRRAGHARRHPAPRSSRRCRAWPFHSRSSRRAPAAFLTRSGLVSKRGSSNHSG